MANLGDKEAVVAMSLNLGEYYRYTTRMENSMTTVREELKLVENYLIIQQLRIQRLHYEIDIPEEMMDLQIPRLLIQPIVENSVVHGIESQLQFGIVHIKGLLQNGLNRLIIDDNGSGLTKEELVKLRKSLAVPLDEHTGCGLWNTHQRLTQLYGGHSGLRFSASPSPLDGFRTEIIWEDKEEA